MDKGTPNAESECRVWPGMWPHWPRRNVEALGLMIKANSFGEYFALLCHESTYLSEKGKRLSVSSVFTFRHSGSALSVRAAFYSYLPQLG